jgi:DNA-binding CsgD family transcriptional regulator
MAGSRADGPDSRIEEFTDRYQLTPREQEVFLLVISGHITKQVAGMLGISYYTAVTHVKNIYKKTGASSKVELLSLLNRFYHRRATEIRGSRARDFAYYSCHQIDFHSFINVCFSNGILKKV